jgi:hypothetical protein
VSAVGFEGVAGIVFSPEDGGTMFLRNDGIYLQVYTASEYGRQKLHLYRRENLKSNIVIVIYFSPEDGGSVLP